MLKNIGNRIIAALALAFLFVLALFFDVQPLTLSFNKLDPGTSKQILLSQNRIVPIAESSILFYNISIQPAPRQYNNEQLNALLFEYNQQVKCSLKRQFHFLATVYLKYRKSDFLFPSHYFW
ncbi:hypothetical protein ACT3CE_04765 [Marinifilum sp. RC60d5]|uniref:hypothetical protein n=1 Tax=Marinifilum sp. RC60d5 TaxID=3458414 RepID=UPI0040372C2A